MQTVKILSFPFFFCHKNSNYGPGSKYRTCAFWAAVELDALPALTSSTDWGVKASRVPEGCSKTINHILEDCPNAMLAAGWLAITDEPDGKGDKRCQGDYVKCGFLHVCVWGERIEAYFHSVFASVCDTCFTHNSVIFILYVTHLSTYTEQIQFGHTDAYCKQHQPKRSNLEDVAFAYKQVQYSLNPPQQTGWKINSRQQPNILQLCSAGKYG